MLNACPKCRKPNDDCACEVFRGLESAYDPQGFITSDENFKLPKMDLGSHYRHSFMGHKIDVYRVLEIFKVTDPVAQHIVKKLLRGEKKGHTMDFVWNEVKQAVERKFEMIEEDK